MMDSIKDYFSPKRFSISAYVCVILHSICGGIFIAITTALKLGEKENFSCKVDTTFATHKDNVEETCFSIYNDDYNSPVRLFAFVLLSFGSVAVVSLIYVLAVGSRVDEVEKYFEGGIDGSHHLNGRNQPGTRTLYIFYFYFFHVVVRAIFGVLFTILQFTVLYDWSGFDSEFSCIYPDLTQPDLNITTAKNASVPQSMVTCINLAAQDKQSCSYAVFGCNVIFTLPILFEVIYMIKRLTKSGRFPYFKPKSCIWSCDLEFVFIHFLRKQHMPENIPLIGRGIPTPNTAQIYKENILKASLTSDINYGLDRGTSLDELFIDVVIQTERAPLKFSKDMTRHEINDVYMKVPDQSIRLEEVKDLFHSNKNTNGNSPRTTLVLGRPRIGKTVLSRKIMRGWARGIDEFYHGKIAFFFRFRWFHFEQLQNLTLKKFLQLATELSEDAFESVFEEIWENPQNAIFVFDGFDEYLANLQKFQDFLDQSKNLPSHSTSPMSATFLFIKILSGQILPGATVLVTSRPTAIDVLSKLHFDRKVEIIGFTEEKIENYVEKFCANNGKDELKPKIWNHIKSSELKNMCYIPVNCFIVCFTLFNFLSDEGNDSALPTTLTDLYREVLRYFKHRSRDLPKEHYQKVIKELQQLAFDGIKNDQLIFDSEFVNEQMEKSGLLHRLPVPFCQPQTCFIHLTVQEFLAAKHIVETKKPEDVEEFITSHVKHGKWHLVLQFVDGLLGKRMKMYTEYKSCLLAFREHLQNEIEGNSEEWKWVKCSTVHRETFVKLCNYGKAHPEEIREINGVRVCCSEDFLIGIGSDGTRVYVGLGKDGYERAVKRLRKDTCSALAEQETKILNEFNAKNSNHVVNYYFFEEKSDKEHLFLIMDLCEETLKTFVHRSSLDELILNAAKIVEQILKGLADLHSDPKPILHRDIKPSNLLRDVRGNWLLADFGISRILPQGAITHGSSQRGTEDWRAVESYPSHNGTVRYKKESDIQVVGIVAFYIITKGKHPFGEKADRLRNLLDGKPVGLDMLEDDAARDFITRLLRHDPKDRPTAEEALKHPFLQPEEQQFEMLCKMGNQKDIKTGNMNSPVVRNLNNNLENSDAT